MHISGQAHPDTKSMHIAYTVYEKSFEGDSFHGFHCSLPCRKCFTTNSYLAIGRYSLLKEAATANVFM